MREAIHEEERGRENIPFSDDYRLRNWGESQPGYIEVPGGQGPPDDEETPQEEYTPSEPPDHMRVIHEEEETPPLPEDTPPLPQAEQAMPERQTTEPEIEMIPSTVPNTPVQAATAASTPLQQAMYRNLDTLDGHPQTIRPPPGLSRQERSRSPVREAHNVPAPRSSEDGLFALGRVKQEEEWHLHCMLAKRFNKKKRQVGAGAEINYDKASPEVKKALDSTRGKEWNNWKQFDAVFVVPPDEKEKFLSDHPEAVILPTRWVDVNKAEQHEEPRWKSRLVVRGDLEKNNDLRTDSPTTSQLILQMIISLAAATGTRLRAGDISAAFLQGTGITTCPGYVATQGRHPRPRCSTWESADRQEERLWHQRCSKRILESPS